MKKAYIAVFFGLAWLMLTGCSTIQSRINEKQTVFVQLDPTAQEKVRKGEVDVGFTTDMVYMALGDPSEAYNSVSKEGGNKTTWIYYTYYQRFEGMAFVGYRRVSSYDPKTQTYFVYYEPVHEPVYSDQRKERIRIVFKDGRIASIEQLKN